MSTGAVPNSTRRDGIAKTVTASTAGGYALGVSTVNCVPQSSQR